MSLNRELHAGDIGTVLRATLRDGDERVSVAPGTTVNFYLRVNGGTILERAGTPYTDGSDGTYQYVLQSGDVMEPGTLYYQVRMFNGTSSFSSEVKKVPIKENISDL